MLPHPHQAGVTKQGFPRIAINLVLRCCPRALSPELVGPCHAHPFAVREGLSRLLLFPLLIAVHLVVKEVLRAHTQQSLSSPGLGGNGRAKKLELWGAPGPQEKAMLRRIRRGQSSAHTHPVLGPGVPWADDCRLLVPRAPVCWPVVLRELQELHPAKLSPLRNAVHFAALHDHHITGDKAWLRRLLHGALAHHNILPPGVAGRGH